MTYLAYRKKDGILGNIHRQQSEYDSASDKAGTKGNDAGEKGGSDVTGRGSDETAIFKKDESANVNHSGKRATPTSAGEFRKRDEKAI